MRNRYTSWRRVSLALGTLIAILFALRAIIPFLKGGPEWLVGAALILAVVVFGAIPFVRIRKAEAEAEVMNDAEIESANEWTDEDKAKFKQLMDPQRR
jgi:hypothetical protein